MSSSIHVKLERDEAVFIKKESLNLEKDLLETIKYLRNYDVLRKKEFILKLNIKKDLAMLSNLVASVEENLPKEEVHIALKETKEQQQTKTKENKFHKKVVIKEQRKSEIEKEIDEIKQKLAMLE